MIERCVDEIAEGVASSYHFFVTGAEREDKLTGDLVIMAETTCDCRFKCKVVAKYVDGKIISIEKRFAGICVKKDPFTNA